MNDCLSEQNAVGKHYPSSPSVHEKQLLHEDSKSGSLVMPSFHPVWQFELRGWPRIIQRDDERHSKLIE